MAKKPRGKNKRHAHASDGKFGKLRFCKCCNTDFHGFIMQKGMIFGVDGKGYFVSSGHINKLIGCVYVYRYIKGRDNSEEWQKRKEYPQVGTMHTKYLRHEEASNIRLICAGKTNPLKIQYMSTNRVACL
jgi:hypothetical protein